MNLGLVFKTGDPVLIGVFLSLVLMSIVTWVLVIVRTIKYFNAKNNNRKAGEAIWASNNLTKAHNIAQQYPQAPVAELTINALAAHRRFLNSQDTLLSANLPQSAYLERELRHSINKIQGRFDLGMTALATIGSTAPFIGLLGTVWGIYHALINISASGQISITAVAEPIGEALVATAIGLFVAIPAVLAYNFFTRGNKNLSRQLHDFAHDLHVQLINAKE